VDSDGSPDPGQGDPEPAVGPPPPGPVTSANASGKQLFRNVVNSYVSLAVGVAMSLVLTRALLRHLGAGTYGLWVVLVALVSYLGILDVGVGTAAVQRVARLMATDDKDGLADLIRTLWAFFAVSAVLAVAITVGVAPFVASFLHLGTISPSLAGATLIILGVMTALTFLSVVPNAVLYGSGRNDRQTQIGLVTLVLMEVGQIVAVSLGAGLIAVAILQLAGVALTLALSATLVGRITGSSMRRGRFSGALLRDLLRFGGIQSVVALSGLVAYQLDALVIGVILPVAQVAPYNLALNTSNLTNNVSTQATALLMPTYAHFDEVGDRRRQAGYFLGAIVAVMGLSVPIVIALAAFGEPMLKLWLGNVPPKTYEIMIVLGVVTLLQRPGNQCFLFLTGIGRNRQLAVLASTGAAFNLAGSIVATYLWGPVGPALGSLPVVLVIDFVVLPMTVCRYLDVSLQRYLRTALAPVVPTAVAAGVIALALVHLHPAHSGLAAVVGAVVTVGLSWLVLVAVISHQEPELRAALLQRLRARRR
jgi:O-antigen/teichoic acid export membrane protein